MPFKILIVNPNSTATMTAALEPLIAALELPNILIEYFTAPPPAPASINDHATVLSSAEICLPILTAQINDYDAFLIACYSDHPLVPQLRAEFSRLGLLSRKFVLGIFEASIMHALSPVDNTPQSPTGSHDDDDDDAALANWWGIVSTGRVWEELLTLGVEKFLGTSTRAGARAQKFAGVATTGLNAIDLHTLPREEVLQSMKRAVRKLLYSTGGRGKVTTVCLGCAGMAGLEGAVNEVATNELGYPAGGLRVIDGVKSGVLILEAQLKGKDHIQYK